jgi:hypothetical protein
MIDDLDPVDESADPIVRLAIDICLAAVEAVKEGEIGAEGFFYSRRGENLLLGLGIDPDFIAGHLREKHKMAETTLAHIATNLKKQAMAAPNQPVIAALNGGLQVRLIYQLTHWRLSVSRPNARPSEAELAACRRAFAIPDEEREEYAETSINGTTYHIRRWKWASSVQLNFVFQEDKVVAYYNEAR